MCKCVCVCLCVCVCVCVCVAHLSAVMMVMMFSDGSISERENEIRADVQIENHSLELSVNAATRTNISSHLWFHMDFTCELSFSLK